MSAIIRIDHQGDGHWIMDRVGGTYNERTDHTVAVHRNGRIQGGVVYTGYVGRAIAIHMAGEETNWATKDFLWMVFDYAFNQLNCRKLIGLVPSHNTRAISVDLRLGFRLEGRLTEMLPDITEDLLILTMRKEDCKWLKIAPKHYRSGGSIRWVA